jgi:hypothetical protein
MTLDRYAPPAIWAHHAIHWRFAWGQSIVDWRREDEHLGRIRVLGLEPLLQLVLHGHGSRPTGLPDETFVEGVTRLSGRVAARYPWVRWSSIDDAPLAGGELARVGRVERLCDTTAPAMLCLNYGSAASDRSDVLGIVADLEEIWRRYRLPVVVAGIPLHRAWDAACSARRAGIPIVAIAAPDAAWHSGCTGVQARMAEVANVLEAAPRCPAPAPIYLGG